MAKAKKSSKTYLDKLEADVKSNQSRMSLILGALIVVVLGVLLFNYFNRNKGEVSTADQNNNQTTGDVSPDNLPGKYTVKDGDTLFTIADKYYKDGYKYPQIAKANNISDENVITTGQVLDIPKLEASASNAPVAEASPTETPSESPTEQAVASSQPTQLVSGGTGGGNTTIWGPNITGDSYTVVEGDWLSTIAARAYGDIMSYDKIAKANNIADPNLITPGTVLKLPR